MALGFAAQGSQSPRAIATAGGLRTLAAISGRIPLSRRRQHEFRGSTVINLFRRLMGARWGVLLAAAASILLSPMSRAETTYEWGVFAISGATWHPTPQAAA